MEKTQIINSILDKQSKCIKEIVEDSNTIEKIVDALIVARDSGKKIFTIGNGGSGSTASHFVADLLKTAITKNDNRFNAISLVDNIPVMFAVLTMTPDMSLGQWLLVTLTAGVGGSMLSVGSAAGVALMGQSKGYYTFVSHLKWAWAIALGYIASILTHLWLNAALFDVPI